MSLAILGIESSCDETSASVCQDGKIINNIIATQSIHKRYGGVVPELASRAHQKNIVPVINEALKSADIPLHKINAIACTQGPGLLGALLVGNSFAKTMAFALNIPIIHVNHMQAHVLAHFIEDPKPKFPFLCLTISGGHTQLVKVTDYLRMEVIGQTRDDAAGEAFDKCAKLLNLEYPGGPEIDQLAKTGDPHRFEFPESDVPGYDYSFSGVKTSFLYFLRDHLKNDEHFVKKNLHDLAASLQQTLIRMLFKKLVKAARQEKISQIALAGGVAANLGIRQHLQQLADQHQWEVYIPAFEYCTDNAAMIAMTGYIKYQNKEFGSLRDNPLPRMTF